MKWLCLCFLLVSPLLSRAQVFEANPTAAKEVWESVIAAKGGRERLHAVRTFGVRMKGGTWYEPGYQMRAYEFPSKVWMRTGPIEPFVGAYDSERRMGAYVVRHYRELHAPKKGQVEDSGQTSDPVMVKRDVDGENCYAIRNFLLETSWYRPEIVAVTEMKWRGQDAFVLYVNGCSNAYAYIIDAKTRLPSEVIGFLTTGKRWDEKNLPPIPSPECPNKRDNPHCYSSGPQFEDYVSVEGVMLPKRLGHRFGNGNERLWADDKMTYEINREYPDSLFMTPPTLSDWGPWPSSRR